MLLIKKGKREIRGGKDEEGREGGRKDLDVYNQYIYIETMEKTLSGSKK